MEISCKGVIFDLDGVLTDTAKFHFVAWSALADSLGISIDEQFNEDLKGVDRMTSLDKILEYGGVKLTQEEKLRYATAKNEYYKELISSMTSDDVLPGVLDRLSELREMGLKIGLASASKNAPAILKFLNLEAYFDAVANVELIKTNKPAPDIFLLAADNLGLQPADCLGVEDAAAGIQAIRSAGMKSVGIGSPEVLRDADIVFPDMTCFSFPNLLRKNSK